MFSSSDQTVLFFSTKPTRKLLKSLAIFCFVLYVIHVFSSSLWCNSSHLLNNYLIGYNPSQTSNSLPPTNATHIAFGIASLSGTWQNRRYYVESWWRPNVTRGFLFLDKTRKDFFPWSPASPPLQLFEDTSRYEDYNKHKARQAIRMVHMIAVIFRAENQGVRWYAFMDDDTVVFVDNLVDVLSKYDHRKYFYMGANSESIASNVFNSFEMAFGGGGYVLSYPLVEALVKNLDIDLHHDISGFLSSHPQSPLLSLHHLNAVDPIYPATDRYHSLNHLMKAATADSSRLFQQTICHSKQQNLTFSISWGYSAHAYEGIHPPSILQRPLETFWPWTRFANPPYMYNTRILSRDPCRNPRVFFFDSVEEVTSGDYIVTSYNQTDTDRLRACSKSENWSVDYLSQIRVLSPLRRYNEAGNRRECCDIVQEAGMNASEIKLRPCMKDEFLA
ncbi:hypothetical protein RHGRI_002498 [Rhododendron griersonianum]|uniref:Fringe-like glycosyltransferase domain-containing protein n=1 Tax=Rhododendron griersonianum TaxID=479676 RepID=A0AAV6LQG5_9ERIC|nr:hypothetical protein RHGRI_002498 [Rhododendron griersonianum]